MACFLGRSASDNRQIVDDRGGEGIALVVDGAARRCHGSGSGRCRRLLRFRTKLIEYRLASAFGWFFIIGNAVEPPRHPGRPQPPPPTGRPSVRGSWGSIV